jgi:LEA14-like dessication related protein
LKRYIIIKLFCLLLISTIGVGCSALNVQKPTAAISGMSVQDVNTSGFSMNFDVDVTNPNTMSLPLTAADYKLGASGMNVLEGKAKPEGSIPPGGSKRVTLPVTLTYENLLAPRTRHHKKRRQCFLRDRCGHQSDDGCYRFRFLEVSHD